MRTRRIPGHLVLQLATTTSQLDLSQARSSKEETRLLADEAQN